MSSRDLTSGRRALVFWCVPVAALLISSKMGDGRWVIWTASLTVMGAACLVNAARCRRLHCYLTGPAFLLGAGLSLARGLSLDWLSWNWISAIVLVAWVGGIGLEHVAGRYVGHAGTSDGSTRGS